MRFPWSRVAQSPEPACDIQPGSLWVLKGDEDDPFPRKNTLPVKILEVRQGWVRYYMGRIFPDNRKKETDFLRMYMRWES